MSILVDGITVYPTTEPELVEILDDNNNQLVCPECHKHPLFFEDEKYYYVTCGCIASMIEINCREHSKHPTITKENIRDFLAQMWVGQIDGDNGAEEFADTFLPSVH